jgi:CRISPR/Cas system CMR-associated protein Cmr1 (group 7 of RAMP superfamily)
MHSTELPYRFSPKKTNLNSWHTTTSAMTIDKYKTNIKYQSQAIFGQYVKNTDVMVQHIKEFTQNYTMQVDTNNIYSFFGE